MAAENPPRERYGADTTPTVAARGRAAQLSLLWQAEGLCATGGLFVLH